ncbi:MAG TPA: DNA-deoxyinosine glycosylase [Flavobacterium sp.]|jgi:hypoxanthine-DNA glycosylase
MKNKLASFPPIVDENSEILILGTMPGAMSLAKQEYYGFPQNAFWKIMFTYFDALPLPSEFEQRVALLRKHKIALWDVLAYCDRQGSLDINIKNQIENDIPGLLRQHPKITRILFNGKESYKYFGKKFKEQEGISYHVMPSTSPANTVAFAEKLKIWSDALS